MTASALVQGQEIAGSYTPNTDAPADVAAHHDSSETAHVYLLASKQVEPLLLFLFGSMLISIAMGIKFALARKIKTKPKHV